MAEWCPQHGYPVPCNKCGYGVPTEHEIRCDERTKTLEAAGMSELSNEELAMRVGFRRDQSGDWYNPDGSYCMPEGNIPDFNDLSVLAKWVWPKLLQMASTKESEDMNISFSFSGDESIVCEIEIASDKTDSIIVDGRCKKIEDIGVACKRACCEVL